MKLTYKSICEARGVCNLRGANLYGADLSGADLRDAYLRDAYLSGADLRGANLRNANLYGAYLRDANLRGADLYGADLRGASLRDANLYGADLRNANLCGANLRGVCGYIVGPQRQDGYRFDLRRIEGVWLVVAGCNTGKNWTTDQYRDHTKGYKDKAKTTETLTILDYLDERVKEVSHRSVDQEGEIL